MVFNILIINSYAQVMASGAKQSSDEGLRQHTLAGEASSRNQENTLETPLFFDCFYRPI